MSTQTVRIISTTEVGTQSFPTDRETIIRTVEVREYLEMIEYFLQLLIEWDDALFGPESPRTLPECEYKREHWINKGTPVYRGKLSDLTHAQTHNEFLTITLATT